jgi:hypothetical protein
MADAEKTIRINSIIDIRTDTLEAIVKSEKEAVVRWGTNSGPIDTAGKVGELISRFLLENDFDSFARNPNHYSSRD